LIRLNTAFDSEAKTYQAMTDIDLFGLKGVHVVITGASGGIGAAAVKLFDKLGANISAQAFTNSGVLKDLEETTQFPLTIIRADVTKEDDVEAFYRTSIMAHGPPQVLVGIMMQD
jgi:NAD(P)-dependent dehydrogenase (short-subunit alcohol dehydrogenase family)